MQLYASKGVFIYETKINDMQYMHLTLIPPFIVHKCEDR
jgi:hypothetical protein